VTEILARESKVSHAWNSTAMIYLKQGLKIGYLPPTKYNSKSLKYFNDSRDFRDRSA